MGLGFVNMALLYPRFLPAAEFGLTRLVLSVALVAAQFAQVGLEATVIRFFPYLRDRSPRHGGLFRIALLVATGGAMVAMAVLHLFHAPFARWFNDHDGLYGRYGSVVLPLVLAEVHFLVLRGISRSVGRSIAPVFLREFLVRLLQTALIVVHILTPLPFGWFLAAFAGTFVLTTLLLFADLWRAGKLGLTAANVEVPRRMAHHMARYALFGLGVGVAGVATGNVDQMMLAAMLPNGLNYVAYYAVALFLASVITVPARALVMPALPVLAEAWRKRDHARIRSVYARSTMLLLIMGLYVMLCVALNMNELFELLKPEYAAGRPVLLLLGVTNVVALAGGLSGSIIGTSRSYAFDASSSALYFGLNVLFDFFFIKWVGMVGVAWSSLLTMLIVTAWRVGYLRRRHGLWPYEMRAMLLLGAITLLSCWTWWMPSTGSAWLDGGLRCVAITATFWPLVGRAGLAPELLAQWEKVRRRLLQPR
jgi:O-antigen/teichoic acid export membrane protein